MGNVNALRFPANKAMLAWTDTRRLDSRAAANPDSAGERMTRAFPARSSDATLAPVSPVARCTMLPASVLSSRAARLFTQETLEEWRVPMTDDVLHVVDELVTNAVVHTTGPVTLALDLRGRVVRIVVADESNALPTERAPNLTSTEGRGLILVAAMSRTWGVRDRDGGKTVWADVALHRGGSAN
jgi:anti-sigma regulatory factor (Ser/Thr protein kinase)